MKTKKLIEIKVSLKVSVKETTLAPTGINIWKDQFDPEN